MSVSRYCQPKTAKIQNVQLLIHLPRKRTKWQKTTFCQSSVCTTNEWVTDSDRNVSICYGVFHTWRKCSRTRFIGRSDVISSSAICHFITICHSVLVFAHRFLFFVLYFVIFPFNNHFFALFLLSSKHLHLHFDCVEHQPPRLRMTRVRKTSRKATG